jgi:hypothetical protein
MLCVNEVVFVVFGEFVVSLHCMFTWLWVLANRFTNRLLYVGRFAWGIYALRRSVVGRDRQR